MLAFHNVSKRFDGEVPTGACSQYGADKRDEAVTSRLLALHLGQRTLREIVVLKLSLHDIIDGGHFLRGCVMKQPTRSGNGAYLGQNIEHVFQRSLDAISALVPPPVIQDIVVYGLLVDDDML